MRLERLVCLGICRMIQLLNFWACSRISESLGFMISSKLQVAQLLVSIPPQGGQIMMASVVKGSTSRKSWLMYFSLLILFLQTFMLCFSILNLAQSISLTMYSWKLSQRWMAIPPIPLKGSKILVIFLCFSLSLRCRATCSGITEYQLSSSISIPSSNLENKKCRLLKYRKIFLFILYFSLSYLLPWSQLLNSKLLEWIQKQADILWI